MKILRVPRKGVYYQVQLDDEDYERVAKYSWRIDGTQRLYVSRTFWDGSTPGGRNVHTMLHRFILSPIPKGMVVDHINGDGLDNRRCNLRLATPAQNSANQKRMSTNTTGFKGVSFYKRMGRWRATITVQRQKISLGYFDNPIDAARAYDTAAIELSGEFAKTNFGGTNGQ